MTKGWQREPQWQFVNSNPNPRMRPSVDALLTKLRTMKLLNYPDTDKTDPSVIHLLADDLIHHHFVREGKIDDVFYHLQRVHRYWFAMVNEYKKSAKPWDPEWEGEQIPMMETIDAASTPAEPPEITAAEYREEDFKDFLLPQRGGIEAIILKHMPEFLGKGKEITCDCERVFYDENAWAKHLRIRIEKYLLNEFTPHVD